jgi:acetylornithine deacetylase/succinyl-diaminopimelate desuccinylase-like protein
MIGMASHAGTTPMDRRRDAAADMQLSVDAFSHVLNQLAQEQQ